MASSTGEDTTGEDTTGEDTTGEEAQMATSERGGKSKAVRRPVKPVHRKPGPGNSADSPGPANPLVASTPPGQPKPKVAAPVERLQETGYLGSSAPPIEVPRWKQRRYIERPADLVALCHDLMDVDVLALDAEFSQSPLRLPDKPSLQLSLVQLAIDQDHLASYVVDARRIADLSPLQAPLENSSTLKLFHSIGSDAKVLSSRGLVAGNTLDLEAVSRSLFGQRESGLQSMLFRACNVWLDKSYQRADWARRPLTPGMLAYAAQDAEMTMLLYRWLKDHYEWAVELHLTPANEPSPALAEWILPYLEGSRQRHIALAVADAGIATDSTEQEQALRHALRAVHHPVQRARVIRLITDLDLTRLAPDLYPYLASPASEERQSAVRGIGRLHDKTAIELIRPLSGDSVQDVRQAATLALEQLSGSKPVNTLHTRPPHTPVRLAGSLVRWSSESAEVTMPASRGWQDTLRAHFGLPATPQDDAGRGGGGKE